METFWEMIFSIYRLFVFKLKKFELLSLNSEQKISPTTQKFVKILSNLKKIELISYFFIQKNELTFKKFINIW